MPKLEEVDPELIVDAVLMSIEDKGEAGMQWLRKEHARILGEVLAGAERVKMTGFESESSTFEHEISAPVLLAILTQCRKRLQDGGSASSGVMLTPRLADFPFAGGVS
jgi:hypothetical protein